MIELAFPIQSERARVRRRAIKVLRRSIDCCPEGASLLAHLRSSSEAADAARTLNALGLSVSATPLYVKRPPYTEVVHSRFLAYIVSRELLDVIRHCADDHAELQLNHESTHGRSL